MKRPDSEREHAARAQLASLFIAHHEGVARYVRRRTAPELVDDAVAETFLVACRRPGAIPPDPFPWLLGVARRVAATQRRSAHRRFALATRLAVEAPQPNESATAQSSDLEAVVRDALERLSEPDREAITLIAWEGLTPAQAAVVLGVTRVAFRARLSRARRRLRKQLAQELPEPGSRVNPRTCLEIDLAPKKEEARL